MGLLGVAGFTVGDRVEISILGLSLGVDFGSGGIILPGLSMIHIGSVDEGPCVGDECQEGATVGGKRG